MYLYNHGLLSANLFTALIKNTDDWYSGMDRGKCVETVLVNLKKAFDTVDYNIFCRNFTIMGFKTLTCSGLNPIYQIVSNSQGLTV